jgi:holo-[acyl-carrier protein] synthase
VRVACGIDLVEIDRVAAVLERHPRRFLTRHFTDREIAQAASRPQRLAVIWAAKEAAVKALGTGVGPVDWREVEVLHQPSGQPVLHLHGRARRRAEQLGLVQWSVSLSHSRDNATAVVVAVG